jgi:tripeptidyl-peptidase I
LPANGSIHDKEIVAPFGPGGGFSNHFAMPAYQEETVLSWFAKYEPAYNSSQYNNTRQARGFPDVALNGQNYVMFSDGKEMTTSGTSAAAPSFSAMISLINGERIKMGKGPVGFVNPVLYRNPQIFNDVVSGNNPGCGTTGFSAVEGWDPASGLGTPDYRRLKEVFLALP